MPTYNWLTFIEARAQLAQRLYDTAEAWTVDAELGVYIKQALRMFNALTWTWKREFVFSPGQVWNNLGDMTRSPRPRTLTDIDCYRQMQYMLLEPPSGGTWTGTPQFDMANFSKALQLKRDEMIKVSNCNQRILSNIPLDPGTRRTLLPDQVIEVARVRYLPLGFPGWGYGANPIGWGTGQWGNMRWGGGGTLNGEARPRPATLYRDDTVAQEYYEPGFYQADPDTPQTFMLSSEPPLTWDVDIPPALPGQYEAVTLQAGAPFAPPDPTLLNVPDDFSWVLIWGALADLLDRESEAVDRQRAEYCMKRYLDGLTLLLKTPWVILAKINARAANIESIFTADRYMPEWDSFPETIPVIVTGGIDFFACPATWREGGGISIGLTVLGNAPVPVLDDDYVEVSRANWDTVLDLAQVFADFKMGGAEWQAALEVETRAIQACAAENTRLKSTGAFSDILAQRGSGQERDQERYATAAKENTNQP